MHDRSLDRQTEAEDPLLEARITAELESAPGVHVPLDFAARMAARAATEPSIVSRHDHQYGRSVAIVSLCVLLALIVRFAHRASSSDLVLWGTVESIFCLQFAVLAVWLVARDVREYFPWIARQE